MIKSRSHRCMPPKGRWLCGGAGSVNCEVEGSVIVRECVFYPSPPENVWRMENCSFLNPQ
jgi:hypothetical protein